MTYSKTHKRFSERLNNLDVLTNPEKYLGPNWKDVLNFWIYVETLSDEEKNEMWQRYWDLNYNVRESARIASRDAPDGVVGREFINAAWEAAYDVTGKGVFGVATEELIAHHKLLEQNKTPTFLPLCVKP
jgi:selenophosphate synthase